MIWLSRLLKELGIGSKERSAKERRLSAACDQLNVPKLHCLEEIARRVCQLVEAYVAEEVES